MPAESAQTNGDVEEEPPFSIEPRNINDSLIKRFERRAHIYTFSCLCIITAIFLLLGIAGYIFFFAQDIEAAPGTAQELKKIQGRILAHDRRLEPLKSVVRGYRQQFLIGQRDLIDLLEAQQRFTEAKLKRSLDVIREQLLIAHGYVSSNEQVSTKEEQEVIVKEIEGFIGIYKRHMEDVTRLELAGRGNLADVALGKGFLVDIEERLIAARADAKTFLPAAKVAKKSTDQDTLSVIRTNLLRFGGIGVTLFLIGILVPIYRYNIRLSGYYLARADALIFCRDIGATDYVTIVCALTPAHAFEKEPKTPLDSASKILESTFKGRS